MKKKKIGVLQLSKEKATMDGFHSSSSRYSSSQFVNFCHCGTRSPMRTSWTTANPGRHFFGCGMYDVLFFSFSPFVYLLSNLQLYLYFFKKMGVVCTSVGMTHLQMRGTRILLIGFCSRIKSLRVKCKPTKKGQNGLFGVCQHAGLL